MNDKTRKCVAFLFALLMMTSIPVVFATVSPHHSQEDIGDVSPVGTVQADHNESTNCQPENEGYTSSLGPCGMRHTNDTPPNASNPEFVIQRYATPAGEGFVTGFVIVNDVVYASYATGFGRGGRFVAYDLVANETLWTRTDGEFVNPSLFSSGTRHEGPSDTPSYTDVNGGMIIVPVMGPGKLIALDAQDGTTEWIFDPGSNDTNVDSHKFFSTAPQIYNGSAYYHVAEGLSGGTWYSESHPWQFGLYKIDLTDGSIQWKASGEDGTSTYHYRHGSIPTIIEDKYVAFAGTTDGTTVRYTSNGTEAYTLSNSMTTQAYNPQNNHIIQVSNENTLRAYDTSGTEVWNETLTYSYTTVNEWTGVDVDPNGYRFGESGSTVHSHRYEKPMQDIATKDDLVALGGMKGNWSLRYASNGTLISRTKVGSSSDTTGWVQSITFVGEDKLLLSVTAGQHRVYQYDISDASNPVEEWNFTRDGPDNEEPGVQGPVVYNKMAYWIETGYGNGDQYPSDPNFWRAGDLENVPESSSSSSSTPTPTGSSSSSDEPLNGSGYTQAFEVVSYDQDYFNTEQTTIQTIYHIGTAPSDSRDWNGQTELENTAEIGAGDRAYIEMRDGGTYNIRVIGQDGNIVDTIFFTGDASDCEDQFSDECLFLIELFGPSGDDGSGGGPGDIEDPGFELPELDTYLQTGIFNFGDQGLCVGLRYWDPNRQTTELFYEFDALNQTYSDTITFDDPVGYYQACLDPLNNPGGGGSEIPDGNVSDLPGGIDFCTTQNESEFCGTLGIGAGGASIQTGGIIAPPESGGGILPFGNFPWILVILAILAWIFRKDIRKQIENLR